MKTLPKYFVIKRDVNNPLWGKYVKWLNEKYRMNFTGINPTYYGVDGSDGWNSVNASNDIKDFHNNPTVITLEEWDEAVNGFKLPEK